MTEFKIDEQYELKLNSKTGLWDTYFEGQLQSRYAPDIFKFYSLNINSIDCLLNQYLYLANPSSFNDPFDCNLNLARNNGSEKMNPKAKRNNITNIGVCCFSETIDDPLMWAHYTNQYRGFAIGFNGADFTVHMSKSDFSKHTLTKVIYPEQPPQIEMDYPFAQHYLLSTKFNRWAYEKEWRLIATINSGIRKVYFDVESVTGIYIGHELPDNEPTAFDLICEVARLKYLNVPIWVVHPHPYKLELYLNKITKSD